MSDSPLLSKMDALLKKHRGVGDPPPSSAQSGPPPGAWLPVLTDVIERGTPPAKAAAMPPAPPPTDSAAPVAVARAQTTAKPAQAPEPIVDDALAEQLMSELAPRLSEVMERQVAAELRKNLDQTVSGLLNQLDVNVREIVRDAVAEKLKQARDPSN